MSSGQKESILRTDVPSASDGVSSVCQSCAELTARVEQLERQLELQLAGQRDDLANESKMTPTKCGWVCIMVHAFVAFCMFTSIYAMQLGILFLAGSFGTVIASQVFSTRSIPVRLLRTVFSVGIVVAAVMAALGFQDVDQVSGIVPLVLVVLPFIAAAGAFVAYCFVWTRGWKLVPPGSPNLSSKLQIRHLLACTLLVAIYLSALRFWADEISDAAVDEDTLAIMFYWAIPVVICTLGSSVLARIILSHRHQRLGKRLGIFLGGAFGLIALLTAALFAVSGEALGSNTMMVGVLIYSNVITFFVFLSPLFTFLMMRSAKYRFIHP